MSGRDIELGEAYLAHPSVSILLPQQWLMHQSRLHTAYSDPDDVASRQLIGLYATYQISGGSGGGGGGVRGFKPPLRGVFFLACQYMKIPMDLDPKPPPSKNSVPEPHPLEEFLDPPLQMPLDLVTSTSIWRVSLSNP